jgi:hypothetical protein
VSLGAASLLSPLEGIASPLVLSWREKGFINLEKGLLVVHKEVQDDETVPRCEVVYAHLLAGKLG